MFNLIEVLKVYCACKWHEGPWTTHHIVIQQICCGPWDSAFLTSSRGRGCCWSQTRFRITKVEWTQKCWQLLTVSALKNVSYDSTQLGWISKCSLAVQHEYSLPCEFSEPYPVLNSLGVWQFVARGSANKRSPSGFPDGHLFSAELLCICNSLKKSGDSYPCVPGSSHGNEKKVEENVAGGFWSV